MIRRIALGIDNLVMRLRDVAQIVMPKYFRDTPPSEEVEKFSDVIDNIETKIKAIDARKWELHCTYNGETRVTEIFLDDRYDPNKPSVIFHHGAGTIDYTKQMQIAVGDNFEDYNKFSIKAQHHSSKRDFFANCVDTFLHWQLTFAGSVLALEEIVKFHRQRSLEKIVSTGISMGGVVTSLHFLLFDKADTYFPIVAYPDIAEIFLGRAYKYGLHSREERRSNSSFLQSFHFPDNKVDDQNRLRVFPILARFDWYIDLGKATNYWKGYDIEILDAGHNSLGIFSDHIQRYMTNKIK